jgi:hypothetical protein
MGLGFASEQGGHAMQGRRLLQALLLSTLAGGCAAPPRADFPPAGAETAGPAYPPIGARWRVRVTDSGLFHSTVEDRDITAAAVDFNGRRGYGLAGPATVKVLDPATFNPIGEAVNGGVAVRDTPDTGIFSWPLWVGKSWRGSNSHADPPHGVAWGPAQSEARVPALENVTVPAGTFRAFRIEYQGGIGSSSFGGRHAETAPGFETRATYWYAPGPKLIVKSEVIRLGTNYLGGARTTTELLTPPG